MLIKQTTNDKISHLDEKLKTIHQKKKLIKKDFSIDFDSSCLEDYGVYFFNGMVDEETTGNAIEFILEANLDPDCHWEYITFLINSSGGYVTDGFALIDVMNGSRIPIRTVGIGMIASMGLQIFLTGQKGTRTLTPNTMILSHQYAGMAWGKEHELVATQDQYDQMTEIVMRNYERTTGLTRAKIREYLLPPSDVWITAPQAKKLGVCDIVKDIKPQVLKAKAKNGK